MNAAPQDSKPQLFVEVKGFLELVNTVDDNGTRTNDNPLLLKLINAPPPMTPAEAEEIRQSAADALAQREAAMAEKERAEQEKAAALEEVKGKEVAVDAAKVTLQKESDELAKSHKDAIAIVEKEKEAAVRAQKQAAAAIEKAEKDAAGTIDRLKAELSEAQAATAKAVAAAEERLRAEFLNEKQAAAELSTQAEERVTQLQQELEKVRAELAEKTAARSPAPINAPGQQEDPAKGSATQMLDGLNLTPAEGAEYSQDIERLIEDHMGFKAALNCNLVGQPAMADPVIDRGSVVIEQVLDLPGNEVFAPKSHFVRTVEDEILYREAMRTKDLSMRDTILRQLSEKQRTRARNFVERPVQPPRSVRGLLDVDPRYAGTRPAGPAFEWPPRPTTSHPSNATSVVQQPTAPRFRPAPPRWLCCNNRRCCGEGCPNCPTPPGYYH